MDHRSTTPTAGSVVTDTPPGIDPAGDPTGIDPTGIDPVGAEVPLATDAAPAELPPEIAPDTGLPVSRARTIRFAAGFLLFGTIWMVGLQMVGQVLLPQRLQDIGVASPEAMLGTANAATAVVSLLSNLVFGNLSDRTRSRFGRRMPWILGGAVIGGGSLAAAGLVASPAPMILLYCVSMVGLNMMLAPAIAVLADRVPMAVRGTMSAFYGAGLAVGGPLGALVGASFITATMPGFLLGGALMLFGGVIAILVWPTERSAADLPPASNDLKDAVLPPAAPGTGLLQGRGRFFMLVSIQMVLAYQLTSCRASRAVGRRIRPHDLLDVGDPAGLRPLGSLIRRFDRLGRRAARRGREHPVRRGRRDAVDDPHHQASCCSRRSPVRPGRYNSVDQALNVDVAQREGGREGPGHLNLPRPPPARPSARWSPPPSSSPPAVLRGVRGLDPRRPVRRVHHHADQGRD